MCLIGDLIVDIISVMWVSTKGHKKVVISYYHTVNAPLMSLHFEANLSIELSWMD